MDVGRALRHGALWTYLQGAFASAVQFGTGIAMARLLSPSDFGVFAAVTAFTVLLLRQAQFGLPESVIRARDLDRAALDGAFWAMEAFAALAFLAAAGLAFALAPAYGDTRFTPLMLAVAANFFLMPLSATAGSWLRRQMRYRELARISVVLTVTGAAVGIGAALAGAGVWSFVAAAWTNAVLGGWLQLRASGWRPGRPRLRGTGVRALLAYGWKLHLNNMVWLASDRATPMVLGAVAGTHALGLYRRAAESARMPVTQLAGRLYQVLLSAYARAQERSPAYAGRMNEKALCAMTGAIYPLLLALWFAAEPFIVGLYGEKWREAVEPMRWLILGAFATTVSVQLGALADARGLAGREAVLQAAGLVLAVVAVLAGSRWGLGGIAAALALRSWLMLAGLLVLVHRHSGVLHARAVAAAVLPAAMAGLAGACCGALAQALAPWTGWWGDVLASAAAFGGSVAAWMLAAALWRTHPGLAAARELMRGLVRRRCAPSGGCGTVASAGARD